MAIIFCMHKYVPPNQPTQTYSQGFWYAVIAASLYLMCSMGLMVNMTGYFMGHYPQYFTLTDHQRQLMLQTMLFFFWLAGGAAVFSAVCGWSYVDALYFCDVTILTVGFGDFYPHNDAGRGLVFPFSVGGIIMLGLMVGSIRRFALELSSDKVIRHHIDKLRSQTIDRSVTRSLDLDHDHDHHKHDGKLHKREDRKIHKDDITFDPNQRAIKFQNNVSAPRERPSGLTLTRRMSFEVTEQAFKPLTRRITNLSEQTVNLVRKKKPRLILLREEKDRFDAMRNIQKNTVSFKHWYNLCISVLAFGLLWCVGAVVFWKAEANSQGLSYFQALYFCYVSLLTIGYGDLSPKSNSGKPFFVVWSLVAVPTMTILVSDMGDTVIASFQRGTFKLADWTVLPKTGIWRKFLEKHPWLLFYIQKYIDRKNLKKRQEQGIPGPASAEEENIPPTLEELAKEDHDEHDIAKKLAAAIRRTANHLRAEPPRRYSYEEWVEITRLIRFSTMTEMEVAEDEEEEGLVNWDWIGENSPLLATEGEAEWVLDRLW
jgi:potassium channel subfamily K, other eukaryote